MKTPKKTPVKTPIITTANPFGMLLKQPPGETWQDVQDRVRRIVPPSTVNFVCGHMFVSGRGFEELARAVLDGRIAGCADTARDILEKQAHRSLAPMVSARPEALRDICRAILDGTMEGDREGAAELLRQLDRVHPEQPAPANTSGPHGANRQ